MLHVNKEFTVRNSLLAFSYRTQQACWSFVIHITESVLLACVSSYRLLLWGYSQHRFPCVFRLQQPLSAAARGSVGGCAGFTGDGRDGPGYWGQWCRQCLVRGWMCSSEWNYNIRIISDQLWLTYLICYGIRRCSGERVWGRGQSR